MARLTKDQRVLVDVFKKADRDLNSLLKEMMIKAEDDHTSQMLTEYQRQVRGILKELRSRSAKVGGKLVSNEYRGGMRFADMGLRSHGIPIQGGTATIHTRSVKVLAEALSSRFADVTSVIGRRVDDVFRTVQLNAVTGSVMGYETVKNAARTIREDLMGRNITGFKDAGGRVWDLETYATMAARTVTAQAHNRGAWNEYAIHGEDLVIVSEHPMSCPKCAPWQGVVLSITGGTPGRPTVMQAEADGLFHPNCRHAIALYVPGDDRGIIPGVMEQVDKDKERIPVEKAKKEPPPKPAPPPIPMDFVQNSQGKAWAQEVINTAPDEIKEIFRNMARDGKEPLYDQPQSGIAHCSNVGISIPLDVVAKGKETYQYTLFHEMGHWVDFKSSTSGISTNLFSSDTGSAFLKAYEKDRKPFKGKATAEKLKGIAELKKAITEPKWWNNRAASDTFCSISHGAVSGGWCHSNAYYKRSKQNGPAEVFAHLFNLTARKDTETIEFLRQHFPSVVNAFEEFIKKGG